MAAAGLTTREARARLEAAGPNQLPSPQPPAAWRQLSSQMFHFFALMLWAASVLAFIAGMPQLGIAIFVVVLINGAFAFIQEFRAERAAERLRDLLPRRATVIRDGLPIEIDAAELVVGDVLLLEAGARISADLELESVHSLLIDASTLTGESVAETPHAGEAAFAGTFVTAGEGKGLVTAIGSDTRLGAIATLTRAGSRPKTPLARELRRVVRFIAAIAIGVGLAFFLISVGLGMRPGDGFLFAIGVTVALVPEGLLPTVTLSLAMGAQRMAERHALVRKLESVETLGSTTFVCTDKTGTLTINQMSVVEVWTPTGVARVEGRGYEPGGEISASDEVAELLPSLALAAARSSTGRAVQVDGRWEAHGDPMEAAIDVFATRLGIDVDDEERRHHAAVRFPFDPERRRMSVVVGDHLYVKGAPDSVLPQCFEVAGAGDALDAMAGRGLRVLAIARRESAGIASGDSPDQVESGLHLLGLLGFEDPPRLEAREAIESCRSSGVRVAMVTGDHPATARAIAEEVGLLGPEGLVVEGSDLPGDDDALGALLDRDGVVVARVAPEEKLRIARALRARGHVVAMTGDGVNDGPALQEANIGIAMGRSGTDVAREAADLVLLDDNFTTIVAAIESGRATFSNIRRFLTYHLTANVAELTPFLVWALSAGRIPLAIGVLQILSLDVGTDLLPALALGAEPPNTEALRRPLEGRHLLDGAVLRRVFAVLGPTEAVMEMAAFAAALWAAGWRPGGAMPTGTALAAASGAAFSAVVIGQIANAFACRSTTRPPWRLGWLTNQLVIWAVVIAALALGVSLYFIPLAHLLGQAPPPLLGALFALAAAPALLITDAANKAWRSYLRRRSASTGRSPQSRSVSASGGLDG